MSEQMQTRLRLTAEDLDVVRANLDWQALFQGLGLQKSAKKSKPDDWWAYSPFHDEATPSFHMGAGGRWYDFSVGEGGGCIELIQRLQGLNCFEAGAYIVEQGWSAIPPRPTRAASKPKKAAQKTQKKIQASLPEETNTNAPIRQNLLPLCSYHDAIEARGVSEATAQDLGIGYLAQGRSPLRGRIVFQLRDARPTKKAPDQRKPVIISHLGRAVQADQKPKYLFYEGFHKSAEILGQDRLWLHPATAEQIQQMGYIVLTEGPFDWAKAVEAGLQNVGASMGAMVSEVQAQKIKALADHHGARGVLLAFDRDTPGQEGAEKAKETLTTHGLRVNLFDWNQTVGQVDGNPIRIPENIRDLADFSIKQLRWLRHKGWL